GIVQEASDFKHGENAIVKVMVTDYSRRDYNFIVIVVFQYLESRFKGLTSHIRPSETVVFVVGQLEFIDNDIYVYAQDINWVDTRFNIKKREYEISKGEILSSTKSTRSKLLSIHQNISKGSEETFKIENVNEISEDVLIGGDADSLGVDDEPVSNEVDDYLNEIEQDNKDGYQKISESNEKLKSSNKKGKERAVRKVVHNTRSSSFKID
ncbi:35582_t:CDS:2, partial [Racocetra persica]